MTIEERLAALESKVEALEKRLSPEGSLESGKKLFGNGSGTAAQKAPAILNGIDEVPRVGNIRAEKLAYAEFPDGVSRWIAVNDSDKNRTMYAEVVPGDPAHCKNVPGTFDLEKSFHDLPEGVEYLFKALNPWYLEKHPEPGCCAKANSWELVPTQ